MEIRLTYDPQKNALQVMDGTPQVPRGSKVSFVSNIGALETQFKDDSPDEHDLPPHKQPAKHGYIASKPGKFKFECFIDGQKMNIGGELEVLPGEVGN
jgi:hypothetical protein